ncbi:undecaprenyl-phosphate galactose phosphotransferase WbaP [Gracilinema caldarium]|uniref:Undecaprenyl-phosphate galactose phosphotransferase, WbaP n=1 Tax=Gracilinema caldarium (strain ATCC 51460 / DSM 7334 / H1) TaxID=744872 RepID=F8EXN3_GRAC1|nr:undecaprenyl-phosphate galactose phosphotransferase WbaP [Gracilinema caldarium]AEJ19614.1 Undecaprenyl-phosphate galactose phosphotransferase, WbaP [Gracilinema caldarium DSM 7334]
MKLADFDIWYRSRYKRTTSGYATFFFIISDLFALFLSFGTGFFIVNLYDLHAINFKSFVTYWPYLPTFILIFYANQLYPGVTLAPAEELRRFFIGSIIGHGAILLTMYLEHQTINYIMIAFIISWFFSYWYLLICRSFTRWLVSKTSFWGIPAVIYGCGASGKLVADRLLEVPSIGYVPVLFLDDDPSVGETYKNIPIIHDTSIGPELVERYNIKMAIVAMPRVDRHRLADILNESVSAFRYNVLIPDFFGLTNMWMSVRDFDGILGLATSQRLLMPWNRLRKRVLDLLLVLVGGILLLPLFLFIALLIKVSSPGPVLYGHTRIGRNGKPFKAYKFRSMVKDADKKLKDLLERDPEARKEWETSFKLKNDPRITPIGKFLRKTSLDEFPQLINVLKNEMSLIGPRPIVEAEIEKYGKHFKRVFAVKPGLTGLWQVSGRSDTDYDERVAFDTYYIQSWSIWLDLWILYKTVGVVFRGKGAY